MQFATLKEVIAQHIYDGRSIALEGFTHLILFATGHEILRQGRRDLQLIRTTPDLIYDQLIGAGCARTLTFSWGGNPGVGSLRTNGPGSLRPERYFHRQKNPSLLRSQTGGKHA